jgi:hypothetical protein
VKAAPYFGISLGHFPFFRVRLLLTKFQPEGAVFCLKNCKILIWITPFVVKSHRIDDTFAGIALLSKAYETNLQQYHKGNEIIKALIQLSRSNSCTVVPLQTTIQEFPII